MSVPAEKTRTWVKPYEREGRPVAGYFREGLGHFNLDRRQFVELLDSLPVGTRFTLNPGEKSDIYPLRGTWEKTGIGGLPYWFNRDRALHRTSADFHAFGGHAVLEALNAAGSLRDREPGRSRKPKEFLSSAETLMERGLLPSAHGFKPGALVQREIDTTMDMIGDVHRIKLDTMTPPKVPVLSFDSPEGNDGTYRYAEDGGVATPMYIRLSKMPAEPEMSLTHEFAHYLDQQIFGKRLNFGSRQARGLDGYAGDAAEHPLAGVMDAIANSQATQTLLKQRDSDEMVYVRGPLGETVAFSLQDEPMKKITEWCLEPEEAFARAYSQYIAERSGNPRMQASIQKRLASPQPAHWTDEDFAPIASAFDTLFDKLGWRGTRAKAVQPVETDDKAAVTVRPYIREGHPVAGYLREIPWRAVMSPELADQWAQGSAIREPLYHATTADNAASVRKEGFILNKTYLFGKVWGDGVYLSPSADSAEFWRGKLEHGDVLETRVKLRNVLQVDVTDDHPEKSLDRGLVAVFDRLGEGTLASWDNLKNVLIHQKVELENQAEAMFPNPYSFRDIHEPGSSLTDPVRRPGAEKMVEANNAARLKREAWLLDHGWVEQPSAEATRRILMQHGYDALEIIDHTTQERMRNSGGPQFVVFDPQNIVVVKRTISPLKQRETVIRQLEPLVGDRAMRVRLTYSDGTRVFGDVKRDENGQLRVGGKLIDPEDVVSIYRQAVGYSKWRHVWTLGEAHK